ncbi:MAG: BCCT family transporter [Alphaproteobacteria bacterium]|nr:BCCT family transporter [Alphaproteobacteria bacterium]
MTETAAGTEPTPGGNLIVTDYEIGQDNIKASIGPFGLDIHNPVFAISGLSIVLFVIGTLAFPVTATGIFEAAKIWVTVRFDWFFILTANFFLLFAVALAISPYGRPVISLGLNTGC